MLIVFAFTLGFMLGAAVMFEVAVWAIIRG
jgi:hypothetical protein